MTNIVFDVGDVLIDFRYEEYMKDLGFSENLINSLTEQMIFSDFWHEMDLGTSSAADALQYFSQIFPGYEKEIREFWSHTENLVTEYPYAKPLIQNLKNAGYPVFLLSNYPADMADLHWKEFSFLEDTDGYIISGKVHCTKPNPKIYHMLAEQYHLNLKECVFIDDREANVNAAKELGMCGILFQGQEHLAEELAKLGIQLG